jgi:predicted DCC family thiol-disulfide oxidoreductase YuxK
MTEGVADSVTLIFDGTCDFCTRCVRYARALDRHHRVTAFPFQKSGVPESFGLTAADCETAAWAIAPGLAPQSGAAAVMLTLAVARGSRKPWVIYHPPILQQILEGIYAIIARYRHRLPGDTPYCEQFPEECGGS